MREKRKGGERDEGLGYKIFEWARVVGTKEKYE
jgi:hypothetical protein